MLEERSNEYQLIYLDIELIADLYDATGDMGVPTTISKTKGGEAGINLGFANTGIQAAETREYRLTTKAMYNELEHKLRLYPRLEGRPVDNSQTFWFDGYLKVEAIWSTTRRAGEITKQEGGKFFVLEGNITTFALLA